MEQDTQTSENNNQAEGGVLFRKPKKKNNKKIILLVLIIIAVLGIASYFLFFSDKEDDNIPVLENEKVEEEKINKELDSDQDGLPDYIEKVLRTDLNNSDTDGDSYSDFEEIKNGYNPLGDEKYTEEEWEAVKGEIKGEDVEFYERIFVDNLSGKRDVLTMAGSKEYANRLAESAVEYDAITNSMIIHNTILVTSDFPDDEEKKVIEIFTASKIRKTAKEVTQEDRDLNNFHIVGNPDTNDFLREIYNKTVIVDVADERDFNVNKRVMKFAKNPWNEDRIISITETNYSPSEVINVKGRIIVEKIDNFYHIVISTDKNESYALVASFELKDDNLVQFDDKYVEITGYKRINNSSKLQFEESIGVINIETIE